MTMNLRMEKRMSNLHWRAWDSGKRRMLYRTSPELFDRNFYSYEEWWGSEESFALNALSAYAERYNDLIFMQCSGLKDKNGQSIYANDIIIYKDKNQHDHIFFIRYELGCFMICRNGQDDWYEIFPDAWNDDVYPLGQLWNHDEISDENSIYTIKVIGNEYENRILLDK